MILGDVLRQFGNPSVVAAVLGTVDDPGFLARAEANAALHGETLGEYASASVRLFSSQASNDDWVALMAAMGRAEDPGAICLRRMLEWAVSRETPEEACCGGCGGD